MNLQEFLDCKHDIDCNSNMTRLYCVKCGQDDNVITYVKKLINEKDAKLTEQAEGFYGRMAAKYSIENKSLKDQLEISRKLVNLILKSNTKIESPLHTLHPSHYTVMFAQSFADNNLDIERARKFTQEPM